MIRNSNDISIFLTDFKRLATYDSDKEKYYFVFHDKERGGQLTLMLTGDVWSKHGIGEEYCDILETIFSEEECTSLVWFHRKAINKSLKETFIVN